MKISPALRVQVLAPAILSLLALPSLAAAPKKPEPLGTGAIRQVEKATGKKLSASQKGQIMAAARQREAEIKKARDAAWVRFRSRVAKASGMSLAQLQAKQKAARKAARSKSKR